MPVTDIKNIQSFTLGFHEYKNDDRDETSIASKFANKFNLTHHSSFIRQEDFFKSFKHFMTWISHQLWN